MIVLEVQVLRSEVTHFTRPWRQACHVNKFKTETGDTMFYLVGFQNRILTMAIDK